MTDYYGGGSSGRQYQTRRLYVVDGPTQPVVSLSDMKKHLRVDHNDDDDFIEMLTAATTQHIDGRDGKIGRALMAQTLDMKLYDFFRDYPHYRAGAHGYPYDVDRRAYDLVEIPLPPLIEVESVKYYDRDDVLQTVDPSIYDVIGVADGGVGGVALKRGSYWPQTYDRPEAVIIRFRAGYVDASDSPPSGEVPAPIIAAIKLYTGTLYENREVIVIGTRLTSVELPWAADALLNPFVVYMR